MAWVSTICALALVFGGGCASSGSGVPNFSVVDASARIYCGGRPNAKGWEFLRGMGVVKSVNLDTLADPPVAGITSRQFPIDDCQQIFGPVGPQLQGALAEVGPGTFVHCRLGRNRSRTLVILYRLRVSGWSKGRATAEACQYGWQDSLSALKEYVEQVNAEMLKR